MGTENLFVLIMQRPWNLSRISLTFLLTIEPFLTILPWPFNSQKWLSCNYFLLSIHYPANRSWEHSNSSGTRYYLDRTPNSRNQLQENVWQLEGRINNQISRVKGLNHHKLFIPDKTTLNNPSFPSPLKTELSNYWLIETCKPEVLVIFYYNYFLLCSRIMKTFSIKS